MPIILALRRLRQDNLEFETNLVYIARPCLKKSKKEWWGRGKSRFILFANI
jgi:hypothetical protein